MAFLIVKTTETDEPFEAAEPSLSDLVQFERRFDQAAGNIKAAKRTEHIAFLMWRQMSRTGATQLDFDSWLDTVIDIEDPDLPDDEVDPTSAPAPQESAAQGA